MTERGKYIVIEGTDGTGKSTQVDLLRKKLTSLGVETLEFHEPDGVPIASSVREIIKNGTLLRDAWTNVMLFTVARRENWLQVMKPGLENGVWSVAARNWISTDVYQGSGERVDSKKILEFTKEFVGEEYLTPDLTLILVVQSLDVSRSRIAKRGELENPDTFESMPDDFQERLNARYINFARKNNIEIIDANQSIEAIQTDIWTRVETLL